MSVLGRALSSVLVSRLRWLSRGLCARTARREDLLRGLMLETRSDNKTCPSDLSRQVTGAGCPGPAARGPWRSGRCEHVRRTAIFQPCAVATGAPRECLNTRHPPPDPGTGLLPPRSPNKKQQQPTQQ